jgi:23S rRNA (cytidine1920-2'-O)/16S rRNA (cytidine1409-2'-O)-methyltransferase
MRTVSFPPCWLRSDASKTQHPASLDGVSEAKRRADLFLVEQGYAPSRSEAQAAIAAGKVFADGEKVTKPAQLLGPRQKISYVPAHPYVSRGALKLAAALGHFDFSPEGRVCLDIGASTGGFAQVLLEKGARRVYAVEVGHGQLHPLIAADPRMVSLEGIDARKLSNEQINETPTALTADVSFISLETALPVAFALMGADAWAVLLVKPQFEAGRAAVGKGGIVRDPHVHKDVCERIRQWMENKGWSVLGLIESPILGGDGNKEFLLSATKNV